MTFLTIIGNEMSEEEVLTELNLSQLSCFLYTTKASQQVRNEVETDP